MATAFTLGIEPEYAPLNLTAGADFVAECEYAIPDPDNPGQEIVTNWPAGTSWSIVFGAAPDGSTPAKWDAIVTGSLAKFSVDKATTAAVPARTPFTIVYTNGTTDVVYFEGTVKRHG